MKKKLFFITKLLIIFPILLLIRLIKPWKIVRIGVIPSHSYGAMLIVPELYLCHLEKYGKGKYFDVFYFNQTIVNEYLAKKQKNLLRIYQWAGALDRFNRSYLGWEDHQFDLVQDFFEDREGLLKDYPCHLTFTDEEHRDGEALMKEMGIPLDKPLVCFFNRDTRFILDTYGVSSKTAEHNRTYRNTDIEDYLPAAEDLAEQGYFLIRMGKSNYTALKTKCAQIFDYVFCPQRSEFLDLYLFSRCQFAFGCATGVSFAATLFRKPVAYANFAPFFIKYRNPDYYDLFLPKKYFLTKHNRLATLDEIIKFNLDNSGGLHLDNVVTKMGIKYLKNTPEEIRELVRQMMDRFTNGLYKQLEESPLQHKFFKKIENIIPQGRLRDAMIPTFYLEKIKDELAF